MTDAQHEPTKEDLLDEARQLDISGRSQMSKEELVDAIGEAKLTAVAPEVVEDVAATNPVAQAEPPVVDTSLDASISNAIRNADSST
jgi:hypothetical protein